MTSIPDPQDPQGAATTPPATGGAEAHQLTDAGALEDGGTALQDMGAAAQEGDARLRAAESAPGTSTAPPQDDSAGRADGAA